MLPGEVDEALYGRPDSLKPLHSRDGIRPALKAFSYAPDGPETLHRHACGTAHVVTLGVAAENEYFTLIEVSDQGRGDSIWHAF